MKSKYTPYEVAALNWYGHTLLTNEEIVGRSMDKIAGIASQFGIDDSEVICVVSDSPKVDTAFFARIEDISSYDVGRTAFRSIHRYKQAGKKFVVVIGKSFFVSKIVEDALKMNDTKRNRISVALNIINGFMVHELAHNKYTRGLISLELLKFGDWKRDDTLAKIADIFDINTSNPQWKKIVNVAKTIYYFTTQVGEDIFINNRVKLSMPKHAEFIKNIEGLMFTKNRLAEYVKDAESQDNLIVQWLTVVTFMKMVVFDEEALKHLFNSSLDDKVKKALRMFYKFKDYMTYTERFELMVDITKEVLSLDELTSGITRFDPSPNGDSKKGEGKECDGSKECEDGEDGSGNNGSEGKGDAGDGECDGDECENGEAIGSDMRDHVELKEGEIEDKSNLHEQSQGHADFDDSGGKALTAEEYEKAIDNMMFETEEAKKWLEEADKEMKKAVASRLTDDMSRMLEDIQGKMLTRLLPNGSEIDENELRLLSPVPPCNEFYLTKFEAAADKLRRAGVEKAYIAFAKKLNRIRTHKEVVEPSKKGRIIPTRLQRYKTGGLYKGIHKNYTIQDKAYQFNFLIDLSGSMWSELYFNAVLHAYFMLSALKPIRGISCHVYGHTTGSSIIDSSVVKPGYKNKILNNYGARVNSGMSYASIVYDIAHDKMTDKRIKEAFGTMLGSGRAIARGNRDSGAITLVSHKFDNNDSKKILFVMSDGAPTDYDYYKEDGYELTSAAANTARAAGIQVYSLSLVNSVTHTNNRIYGKEFNYNLTDMKNLPKIADAIMNN